MKKNLVMPSNFEEVKQLKNLVDGFIIGIKDMCINMNLCIELSELDLLNEINNKEIFISLNKNMHNCDLNPLKNILLQLNNYNIKGVLYYDVAVLNIYNSLNLNYELVWAQEHSSTNYMTINYWNSKGAKYAYLSNDITKEEIDNIIKFSESKLMLTLFG